MRLKAILFWLFPPYEVFVANRAIDDLENGDSHNSVQAELAGVLQTCTDYTKLEELADQLAESELNRKDTIENKASSFTSSIGIMISIVVIVPTLYASDWNISFFWATLIVFSYAIGVLCLLIAEYYAIMVRRTEAFIVPSAYSLMEDIKEGKFSGKQYIISVIASTKWNQRVLLKKTNYLSVAEVLFPRGLILIAFAVLVSISVKVYTS